MTTHYTVSEARNHLGKLIVDAIAGKRIILTHYGIPGVLLVPVATDKGTEEVLETRFPGGGQAAHLGGGGQL